MTQRVVTRRELLKDLGIGAGVTWAATTGVGVAATSDTDVEIVGGILEAIESPATVRIQDPERGSVSVQFTDDATFWRDHPTTIDGFVIGDEVTVEGDWVGDAAFSGTHMVTTFRMLEGRVTSRSGNRLATEAGDVTLTDHTAGRGGPDMHAKAPGDIHPGDYVIALGRIDPSTDEFVAVEIGVRRGH